MDGTYIVDWCWYWCCHGGEHHSYGKNDGACVHGRGCGLGTQDLALLIDGEEVDTTLVEKAESARPSKSLCLEMVLRLGYNLEYGTVDAFIQGPGCQASLVTMRHTTDSFPLPIHGASTRSDYLEDNRL